MRNIKKRIYTEVISKKDLLRIMEAPIDYEGPERMAGDVERKITGRETPYHGFSAIPNMDRDFIELISSKRFKDSVDKVRTAMGDTRTIQGSNALMQLMGTVGQAMQKLVMIQNQNKKHIQHYLFMRFSALNAEEFMKVSKMILKGDPLGQQFIQGMVNEIVKDLKDKDYKDAMCYDEDDEADDDLSGVDFSDLGL